MKQKQEHILIHNTGLSNWEVLFNTKLPIFSVGPTGRGHLATRGAIQVLGNAFSLEIGPPHTPRNANNVVPYTFVTLFFTQF